MKILIAPDKFKGSLNAQQVSKAIYKGLKKTYPQASYELLPMADGGDGSLEIIKNYNTNIKTINTPCLDPLHRYINAFYLLDNKTAYFELAASSGLVLLKPDERNVMLTSTFGTGQLIKHAIQEGVEKIILMIGGSATNDAGLGIANALGYTFLNSNNKQIKPMGGTLLDIYKIVPPNKKLNVNINILCDVKNPFYGKNGAAYVYARQKGADNEQIKLLDDGLKNIAELIHNNFGIDISKLSGSGAAGGVSGGLYGLFGAKIINGFNYLASITNLKEKIKKTDVVITGEGNIDEQSLEGKVIGKISELCSKYKKPLFIIAGNKAPNIDFNKSNINFKGINTIMDISNNVEDAMNNASRYLIDISSNLSLI